MSATMARQGGWVQLEQSDMRLMLNMAKMAKEGFSRAAIEENKYFNNTPRAEVQEQKKQGVELPGHKTVKTAMQRHPAMLRKNLTAGCLPCQKGTTNNPQTCWRCNGTGAPAPDGRRERTPVPTPPLPGTPPAPTGNTSGIQPSQIVNLPRGYTYSNTALPCAEFFDVEETEHGSDFDPDMMTDEG